MAYDIVEYGSIEQGSKTFVYIDFNKVSSATISMIDKHVWYFNRLFVHKELRVKGIGTALVRKVVDFCKSNNISLINGINPYGELNLNQLKQFYIKNGFNETPSKDTVILLRERGRIENELGFWFKSF